MCGGGGDGGGGEGGLGRKASRQLISAPLSSLKGSGLFAEEPSTLRGLHWAVTGTKCHQDTLPRAIGAMTLLPPALHRVTAWPLSQLPVGARQGGRSRRKPKSVSPRPRHAWWTGKAAWMASLQEGLIEASFLKQYVRWMWAVSNWQDTLHICWDSTGRE